MILTNLEIIAQLKTICQKKGYAFFENGDYNLNIIFVRKDDIFDNRFSDTLYIAFKINGIWQLLTIPCTTLAGTLGVGGEQNPLTGTQTGTGVSGTAVIVEGQYRGVYQFIDTYTGWLWYPYFAQIKSMKYYRDNDKNGRISRGQIYEGNYATNLHRMSNNGIISEFVNFWNVGWSQGCMGSIEPEFKKMLPIVREAVKRYGDKFTMTLLHQNDFAI